MKHLQRLSGRPAIAETSDPNTLFALDVAIGFLQFIGDLKRR